MTDEHKNRIEFLRQCELDPGDKRLVDDVEKYGCHIINVREENGSPGWGYTIGIYGFQNSLEVVVVGLKPDTAYSVLNECAQRLKAGARFTNGHRENGLLSNVECEFREVEQRWLVQAHGSCRLVLRRG